MKKWAGHHSAQIPPNSIPGLKQTGGNQNTSMIASQTQHQATVVHNADGSKTIHLGNALRPIVPKGQGQLGHNGLLPIGPSGQGQLGHNALLPIVPNGQGQLGHNALLPIVPNGQGQLGHNALLPIGGGVLGHNALLPIGGLGHNALQPIVGRSPYSPNSGCQITNSGGWPMFCNTSMCSANSQYCCSADNGRSCAGNCESTPYLNCGTGQQIYPCVGCTPS